MTKEEEIIESLTIFDDGVRGERVPRDRYRRIIAETLLRIPEPVREKVAKDATFIIIGGAYGCVLPIIPSELKSEDARATIYQGRPNLLNLLIRR